MGQTKAVYTVTVRVHYPHGTDTVQTSTHATMVDATSYIAWYSGHIQGFTTLPFDVVMSVTYEHE